MRNHIGRQHRKLSRLTLWVPVVLSVLTCLTTLPAAQASAITKSGVSVQAKGLSVNAASESVTGLNPSTLGTASAVLNGLGASSIPMSVFVGNPVPMPASSGDEYSVTTVVGLGRGSGAVSPMTQYSGSSCGYDGSYAVYLCTSMYYNIKSDSSFYFADNHQDSIQATNYDTGSAVLSSLSLTAGGFGPACTGNGFLSGGQTWNIGSPMSGSTYYETPSWSGTYYRLVSTYADFQNAQGTLHWYYRGNPETLNMTFTLPDSQAGWPTGGCTN